MPGLARRDLPERRWLVLTATVVALVTLAGYGGALGGPFHGTVQDWLNGGLFHVAADGKATRLLPLKQGSADLGTVPGENLVLVRDKAGSCMFP